MAGTEYRMDGLDEWEQELARAIEEQYPEGRAVCAGPGEAPEGKDG